MQDGSQYDTVMPWDEKVLIESLETQLELLDKATADAERAVLREGAVAINEDLKTLHGLDFGPFSSGN